MSEFRMKPSRLKALSAAVLALALLAAGCARGGGDDSELEEELEFAEGTVEEVVEDAPVESVWHCGDVKQSVYKSIATLARYAASLESDLSEITSAEGVDAVDPMENVTPAELRDALVAASKGFSTDDQAALDAACELFGQHDAALELWDIGERGDACDVWRPAQVSAQDRRSTFDFALLHPVSAQIWVSATGSIAEGHGRCIAERAN